ncbi:tyrosine--tRNA ligase [Candidatus Magnetomorum sp. HK-1]|nr:tyrosine--tRNA ligase [Candidatus Magnetomorum sp. HK-1]
MNNVYEELKTRGFIEQITNDQEIPELLSQKKISCYIGFDPTADSLHVGSLVPIMALAHMQRFGHRPIALVGGGTALIGDPSGKTEMRQMLVESDIEKNVQCIQSQLSRFISFDDGKALLVNNAEWLKSLQYIFFLRDIGRCFSVNRMLKAESYRMRLESDEGLNFIEFNYMLLQAYDFYHLYNHQDCVLQMGGSDQWGNIVAGIELVRRKNNAPVYGMTFPLITTSSGSKMGKTAKGAIWLDGSKTSPYDYFQFWVNTDDNDVVRFLLLFTFLPVDEIKNIQHLSSESLNPVKVILAYEATRIVHGDIEANKAFAAAQAMFGQRLISHDLVPSSRIHEQRQYESSNIPKTEISEERIKNGVLVYDLFAETGLCASKGEAKRLIKQGGAYINDKRISDIHMSISTDSFKNGALKLRAGKKKYHIIQIDKIK